MVALKGIYNNGQVNLIENPANIESQEVIVIFNENIKKKKREFGCAKGTIELKAGFDDPLDDFKEYMP